MNVYPPEDELLDLRMQCAKDTDELARLRPMVVAARRGLFALAATWVALFVAVLGLRWATRSAQLRAIRGS